jgi:hypothetical protein
MKFTNEKELSIDGISKFNIDNCIIKKDKDMILTYNSGDPILYLNSEEAMLDASIVDIDDKGTQYITIVPFIDIIKSYQDIYGKIESLDDILVI